MLGGAFAQENILTKEEQEWVIENPVLTAINDSDWPPLDFVRSGEAMGFSIDYLNLVASKVGLKIDYIQGPWNELVTKVYNNEINIAHSFTKSSEREEKLSFLTPYLKLPTAYFARRGMGRINDDQDLVGRKVGIAKEWGPANNYRASNPDVDFISLNNEQDALLALSDGSIDVFVGSFAVVNYNMKTNLIAGIEAVGFIDPKSLGGDDFIHLAVSKEQTKLQAILEKGMAAVSDQEFQVISEKWIETFDEYQDIGLSEEEKLWLIQHPILKVSNQENWPPIDFVQNNMPTGLSIDYLTLLASKIGIEFDYVNGLSWNALLEQARDGQIDILHSLYQTDKRSEYLNFTRPYLDLPLVYFGRIGSEPIVNPEDLSGRRVGAIKGWAQTEVFKTEFPHLEIIEFETINEAFLQLSAGKVDVVAESLPVAQYIISQNFIPGLEVIGTDFFTQGQSRDLLRIASHKNEPLLASILQKAMDTVTSQEFKQISDKWQEKYTITDRVDLSYNELRWLSENPIIDVAVDPNAYPYEFVNDAGEIDGVSGDILELIARRLDVEFRWVGNKSLEEGIEMVAAGEVFVLPSLVSIKERLKDYKFTESYLNVSNVIFTREGGEVFGTMESLNGRPVAQVIGYSTTENIKRDYPGVTVIEVATSTEALKKVAVGEVDAFIGSIPLTSKVISDNSFSNIVVTGEAPYNMQIAIAIRADQLMLAGILQKAVASINETEKMIINQKWMSFTVESPPDYTLIWRIIGISLLALTIIFVWALSLRREVSRRELVENNLLKMQLNAEAARLEAEQANNAKSNFLANMSHEIRTPLNAIIGFSELISSEIYGALEEPRYKEYIEYIRGSGLHLSTVINDILDLSKIEAGKWELEEETFLFEEVIMSVFKMVENSAHDKNINIVFNSDEIFKNLMIYGDVTCIKRILINLMSNAIKFTNEGGTISCTISKNTAGDMVMTVSDNGMGIPKHRLEQVLSPFEQVNENSHVKDVGTGLGLSIVKELVELHDGRFRLESVVDQGTDAIVTFPKTRITT